MRGLPADSSPRDAEYVLESEEDPSSVVVSLDMDDGEERMVMFQVLDCLACQVYYFHGPRLLQCYIPRTNANKFYEYSRNPFVE